MEFNYYSQLLKRLNQTYVQLRMEKDLPWSNEGRVFLHRYLQIKNLSEVRVFWSLLQVTKTNLAPNLQIYDASLWTTFHEQWFTFLTTYQWLEKLYDLHHAWTLTDLEGFETWLLGEFGDELEYLLLQHKDFFIANPTDPLLFDLQTMKMTFFDPTTEKGEKVAKMSLFYLKIGQNRSKMTQNRPFLTEKGQNFVIDLQKAGIRMRTGLSLYYAWLSQNQVFDQNTVQFSRIYTE